MPDTTKINVGCGEFVAPGWLNIDLAVHGDEVVVWNITDGMPPVVVDYVTKIYMGHVLEHLERDSVVPMLRLLRDHPMLTSETFLAVVGPDCDTAERMHRRGELTQEELVAVRYGAGRWRGDQHLWRSTAGETSRMLEEAGWTVTTTLPSNLQLAGWPVTSCVAWQFALLAWRSADAAAATT